MRGTDRALLAEVAQEAGQIALRYFRAEARRWDKPAGAGPVTEADLAVDGYLRDRLIGARPDYGWLSEETEDGPARLQARRVFIVDPIDGTRAFIEGAKDWAHSIAVAEAGRIVAAAVHLPVRDALFTAAAGDGATLNGHPIGATERDALGEADVLAARPNFDPAHWKNGAVPPFRRHFRSSLAYRLCLVAQGRFDAMLSLRSVWEWDVAAGSLIVSEAGGRVTDAAGRDLQFNNPEPRLPSILAGGSVHGPILDRLA